ncbi:enoyl-CoA hydratase/isomerase family protein [Georgenia sp. TF02-10]|uniref:enoyl-CoA hydratase/isomerase family protein n=1 Tax=Georgenia sp. TF02-10 TaxID=2917725 RepID=UPI001FA7FAC3|nr:enoyl-CoA hydratase/isomerase family protein [Georgenia sp. TF02-10]UNX54504.1 enoyl-CoA hydratase/isomerase family protein [Georgenia sp. TF02-10]
MSPTGSPAASQAGTGEVVRTAADGVGRITLNRPAAINALTAEMIAAVDEALEAWADDDAVRTVLLDGAGERGFCAGADVRALREAVLDGATERAVGFLRAEYRLDERIATYPKPVVALMDGITMGGGVGLSAHAAVRVVTERSVVAMPETRIGFVPDVGSTHLLGRAPGRTGFHVGLRAASVGPGDAIYLGLADHLVPAADLPALVEELQRGRGREVPAAVARFAVPAPEPALAAERWWVDACYGAPTAREVVRRLEQHEAPGARQAAADLRALSPTAVAVAHQVLARGAAGILRDALALELRAGVGLARRPDFVEGIRAQLVDKDRTPRWRPASLAEVDDEDVTRILATDVPPLW